MSILISFLVGLFLGLIVMGLAAAVTRSEYPDDSEKDDDTRLLKSENAALTDYCNALLDENRRLARSIGREKP
ncbi:MAG: hypothetical protein IJ555_00035 [Ruminococcus sp.]|nr:hypothetical protein [Ruminococcus sp.]